MMQAQLKEQASRYALAVQTEDYNTLLEVLDLACMYEQDGMQTVGRINVIDLFKLAEKWTAEQFDAVEQECVPESRDGHWVVQILTRVEVGGEYCQHHCEQNIEFTDDGLVEFIQYVHLPGEIEKLSGFLTRMKIDHQKPETLEEDG